MKNYSLLVVALLGLLFYSCQSEQGGHSHEDCCPHPDKGFAHRTGHGADPPPCPTCSDFMNSGTRAISPQKVASFKDYWFVQYGQSSDTCVLYPKREYQDFVKGDSVYFDKDTHYVLDLDLEDKDSLLINTGIKVDLITSMHKTIQNHKYAGVVVDSAVFNRGNVISIAGIENAGLILDPTSGELYLSQLYGYLGEMRSLKGLWVHYEEMELYHKNKHTGNKMIVAVDIQKQSFKHHAFGPEGHK